MKKTIICHSFPAWDTPYIKSTVELMKRLSGEYRIIFLDYHYTWKDLLTNPHAPKKRLLGLGSRWRKINTRDGEIEVYNTPPIFPVNWINAGWLFRLVAGINGWLLRGTIRRIQKRIRSEETILINAFNPVYGWLTDRSWRVNRKVYYCYDEISGTQWSSKWGTEYEKKYLEQVNEVITTSPKLKEQKGKINHNTQLVPNGVNLEVFNNPPVLKTKTKVIGYIGAIDDRIDFKLIKQLSSQLPDYQFYMIGPLKSIEAQACWKGIHNIHTPGAIDQTLLPKEIAEMDLCLIPFVKNDLTAAIYPLKINEYLAMGKPVVATHFSDLSDFGSLISIADGSEAFLKAIQRELKGNTRLRIQKRIAFAQQNSWEARAQQFGALL